jgi:MFS family permease
MTIGISSAAIYSVFISIIEDTGLTLGDLHAGTGYMFLLFGWGCLIWQPIGLTYGRRGMLLLSLLGTTAINCWAANARTNGTWIATRCLIGLFGSPVESLAEVVIADVWFAHERGSMMGGYMAMLGGSSFFASVIAGFIGQSQGWQWVLYWCAIFNAVAFVILFFCFEETMYYRGAANVENLTAQEENVKTDGFTTPLGDEEKIGGPVATVSSSNSPVQYRKKTYLQKLALWTIIPEKPNELLAHVYRPLLLLRFPVIFWSGFQYGSNLMWFNVLNATAALILASPPYNFSSSLIGVAYVAPLIGVLLGGLWAGKAGDVLCLKLARRNGGIREPEQRLWLFLVNLFIMPAGLILWGVGAAHGISWGGLVIGLAMVGFCLTTGGGVPINYIVDSYKDLSGEGLITMILIRNTMSFGFNYGITPWLTACGVQNTLVAVAMLAFGFTATFFFFVKFGKRIRKASARTYWRYVESGIGTVH